MAPTRFVHPCINAYDLCSFCVHVIVVQPEGGLIPAETCGCGCVCHCPVVHFIVRVICCIYCYICLYEVTVHYTCRLRLIEWKQEKHFTGRIVTLGRSCLRHCATSWKVAGSIPDSVTWIFH